MDLTFSASDFVHEHSGKLRDTYKIGKQIGAGAYSSVRLARHRATGDERVVKIIHKKSLRSRADNESFLKEASILRDLDHPNIVRLFEYYQDEKNYYMIMEYCNGGELFEKIITDKFLTEAVAADYMRQIFSVILYLHERGIVHRDLKPDNFLLIKTSLGMQLKAIDFGSACRNPENTPMTDLVGTPYFIAPEVLNRHYFKSCDLWSAGVMMYILLCGFPPFFGNSDQEIYSKIKSGHFVFLAPDWDPISQDAKDLVTRLLDMNTHTRIGPRECLDDKWISNASVEIPSTLSLHLQNLKNFQTHQTLEKATLAFIASQFTSNSEKDNMVEIFRALDVDNNGTLSRDELITGYQTVFHEDVDNAEEEIDKIMREADVDSSGAIDYSEFVTATLNRQQLVSRERLQLAFNAFDMDNSGSISPDELKHMLGHRHEYGDEFWKKIIEQVDLDGDGEISFYEFANMMSSVNS